MQIQDPSTELPIAQFSEGNSNFVCKTVNFYICKTVMFYIGINNMFLDSKITTILLRFCHKKRRNGDGYRLDYLQKTLICQGYEQLYLRAIVQFLLRNINFIVKKIQRFFYKIWYNSKGI